MEENNIQNQTNNVQNENEQNSNNNGGKKISIGLVTIVLVLVLGIGIGGGFLITKNEVFNKKNTQNATSSNTNKTENAIQNGGNETESKNYFEANKDLTYTSNPKDSINGKVAIIKRGENIFQTEKHDGYYTYKDMFSNSYDIKEITNITSEYKMTSNNGEVNLFKATIEYIDNNNNKKSFDVAVIVPKDQNQAGIAGTYDNYTGTTSFVKEFTNLYEGPSEAEMSYAELAKFAGKGFENKDYDATTSNIQEYCELTFDNLGHPCIKIGTKSAESTECSFNTKEISNLKSEGAAGTTYVTFDFTAWTAGGDTTGSATLSFSNVANTNEITVSAKVRMNNGDVEFKNIIVKPATEIVNTNEKIFEDLVSRIYRGECRGADSNKENPSLYTSNYTLTFTAVNKFSIVIDTLYKTNTSKITISDILLGQSNGAAGSTYIPFTFIGYDENKNKFEGDGTLRIGNVATKDTIYLEINIKPDVYNGVNLSNNLTLGLSNNKKLFYSANNKGDILTVIDQNDSCICFEYNHGYNADTKTYDNPIERVYAYKDSEGVYVAEIVQNGKKYEFSIKIITENEVEITETYNGALAFTEHLLK